MTRTHLTAAAVAALSIGLAACQKPETQAAGADTSAATDAVKAAAAKLVTDYNAHDADKSVSQDTADFVGMYHGTPNIVGPAADLAQTKQQLTDPATKIEVSDETVDMAASGDLAVWRGTYDYTTTDAKTKKPTVEHGNWLLGFKVQPDKTWKVAWSVVSDTPPPAPPPAPSS